MTEDARITTDNDHCTIDVPHNPQAEAALLQEVRERLSMLERHVAMPDEVASLRKLNDDLYAVMRTVAETDQYGCTCVEDGSLLDETDDRHDMMRTWEPGDTND